LDALLAGAAAAGATARTPESRSASAWLHQVHTAGYIRLVESVCAQLGEGELTEIPTGDTVVCRASYEVALASAACAVEAAQTALLGDPVLCAMRPPGHHAEPERGMGFCVFNNIAVAAAWARRELGPVLIADFDYHHGNGTQAWLQSALGGGAARVAFVSTHAYPAYPGTGAFSESRPRGDNIIIDVPLSHATSTDDFIATWSLLLPRVAERIQPKLILVSAGFDFLARDPIAGLPVSLDAVEQLCDQLARTAAQWQAPLAFILEGGYNLENMRASGAALARFFGAPHEATAATREQPTDPRLRNMTATLLQEL
jgi:acetoin utilization deacetylase AcuC-like enzyme